MNIRWLTTRILISWKRTTNPFVAHTKINLTLCSRAYREHLQTRIRNRNCKLVTKKEIPNFLWYVGLISYERQIKSESITSRTGCWMCMLTNVQIIVGQLVRKTIVFPGETTSHGVFIFSLSVVFFPLKVFKIAPNQPILIFVVRKWFIFHYTKTKPVA